MERIIGTCSFLPSVHGFEGAFLEDQGKIGRFQMGNFSFSFLLSGYMDWIGDLLCLTLGALELGRLWGGFLAVHYSGMDAARENGKWNEDGLMYEKTQLDRFARTKSFGTKNGKNHYAKRISFQVLESSFVGYSRV